MEELNRARRPLRKEVNQCYNEIQKLVQEVDVDKDVALVQFRLLQDAYKNLTELDKRAVNQLLVEKAPDEDLDIEYANIRETKMKVETARVKIDALFAAHSAQLDTTAVVGSVSGDAEDCGVKLPKFKLKVFSGNLLDWLGFWA